MAPFFKQVRQRVKYYGNIEVLELCLVSEKIKPLCLAQVFCLVDSSSFHELSKFLTFFTGKSMYWFVSQLTNMVICLMGNLFLVCKIVNNGMVILPHEELN